MQVCRGSGCPSEATRRLALLAVYERVEEKEWYEWPKKKVRWIAAWRSCKALRVVSTTRKAPYKCMKSMYASPLRCFSSVFMPWRGCPRKSAVGVTLVLQVQRPPPCTSACTCYMCHFAGLNFSLPLFGGITLIKDYCQEHNVQPQTFTHKRSLTPPHYHVEFTLKWTHFSSSGTRREPSLLRSSCLQQWRE